MTPRRSRLLRIATVVYLGFVALAVAGHGMAVSVARQKPTANDATLTPAPLVTAGHAVNWWFVFKFNAASFPGCGSSVTRNCAFGGTVQPYSVFGQQFVYASSDQHALQQGSGACVGDTATDPVGATFGQVYNGSTYYVVWNDQFYGDPLATRGAPWGHSKGMLAWGETGDGFVLQVSTPSWPGAASHTSPRKIDGNTLGCVTDNDVEVSQHFFGLKLTKDDVTKVLRGLQNASVVTDPSKLQIVKNGGPADVQALVRDLGTLSKSTTATKETLSSGVTLISKPSHLNVPPWQMVSALLGGTSLRTATWWAAPKIPATSATTEIKCWDPALGAPGAVDIATTGQWNTQTFGLTGGSGPNFNHAKIGVSSSGTHEYAIFGDLNQQGSLSGPNCASSQNGRGGLFYVVEDGTLFRSIRTLIQARPNPGG